jgi:ketosteroid isomerase-like protein
MLSWLAKRLIDRNMRKLRAGDIGPTLQLDAEDISFRFPGDSSWATELEGKDQLEQWLRRFVEVGLQIYPDEVVVKGFPWKQTICVRGHDFLDTPDGRRVYENRYVIWGRLAWGLLREYEVYEDTQKTEALDQYLGAT